MDPTSPSSPLKSEMEKELAHVTEEMYKKNVELTERNKTLSLLRKIDEVVLSKVTDIVQIAQQVVNTVVNELEFKAVIILLLDKKEKTLVKLAVSQTEQTIQTEVKLNQALFGIKIPLTEQGNLIVKSVNTRRMQLTRGLTTILVPHFNPEQTKIAEDTLGVTSSFIYPLIVRDEVIGAMIICINDSDGLSEFKNDLIDRLAGVVGIAIDNALLYQKIQEANERLQQLDKLKDEFVSLASHELRTPMTVIKDYIWMLLQEKTGPLNEKQKQYLERTYGSTERLINLVNDMLNVSRIESGRIQLEFKSVDILALLEKITSEMQVNANERSVTLQFNKPTENIPPVLADTERMEQVIINLIGNAIKFTSEKGSVNVTVKLDGNFAVVSVQDTGKGIKKEDTSKLFQKFGILDPDFAKEHNIKSTGLGLYISKSLVDLHGGKIWVDSEGENKGSTFSFSLQLYKQNESQVAVPVEPTPPGA